MNLTREEKQTFRTLLFKHQDGVAITNIISVLKDKKVLNFLENEKQTTLQKIVDTFPEFHKGYLNVALRSLASQGILFYQVGVNKITIRCTLKFKNLIKYIQYYIEFSEAYQIHLKLLKSKFSNTIELDERLVILSQKLKELQKEQVNDNYFHNEILIHLEGLLLIPVLVYLNFNADAEDINVSELVDNNRDIQAFLENLLLLQDGKLTKKGQFLFKKSYAYGVTTSYLPIMTNMKSYLYGDFNKFFKRDTEGNEQHVFRTINVWGSGGSHETYFKKIDTILTDIFNRPIEQQPKGIIDVGCGNGALLEHIFNLIWNDTSRKEDLHKNKLILIGADYNKEALLSTQQNLKKADVWAEVVWGDIGNPKEIDNKLQELYNVKLSNLLNIRSFLDHNRPFNPPKEENKFLHISTGAFVSRGKFLNNIDVEQSLVEHLKKWKPYVKEFGLLLIELHTLSPEVVSVNLGKTPCTAYDVTHGFSDQYIVEVDVFNEAVKRAGLMIDKDYYYKFPNSELSTVSINLIS
jgi:hypothetical protein